MSTEDQVRLYNLHYGCDFADDVLMPPRSEERLREIFSDRDAGSAWEFLLYEA